MNRLWLTMLVSVGCDPEPGDRHGSPTGSTTTAPTSPTTPTPDPTSPTVPDDGPIRKLTSESLGPYLGPIEVAWTQDAAGTMRVEYDVDGEVRSTPPIEARAGENSAVVVGVPFGTEAAWRVVAVDGSLAAEAREPLVQYPVPSSLPAPTIERADPARWEPTANWLLVSISDEDCDWCARNYWLVIIDRAGRVVWATRTPEPFVDQGILYAQVSTSGDHLLWDVIDWWSTENSVAERAHLDRLSERIGGPGHHHALVEHPDGTLAWAAESGSTERLYELAPGATAPTEIWACVDWPAANRCSAGRSNSIWYDPATQTYVYSWWSMDSVVEVDRVTGASNWWTPSYDFGDIDPGLPGEFGFVPKESRFVWQHGLQVLDNGHLLASTDASRTSSTRVAEYVIDRDEAVLEEVWSYDPGERARYNGDARRLPGGNTLHGLGARSILYEVTPDHTVVWEAHFLDGHMIGRADVIEDLYALVAPRDP